MRGLKGGKLTECVQEHDVDECRERIDVDNRAHTAENLHFQILKECLKRLQ